MQPHPASSYPAPCSCSRLRQTNLRRTRGFAPAGRPAVSGRSSAIGHRPIGRLSDVFSGRQRNLRGHAAAQDLLYTAYYRIRHVGRARPVRLRRSAPPKPGDRRDSLFTACRRYGIIYLRREPSSPDAQPYLGRKHPAVSSPGTIREPCSPTAIRPVPC